MLNIHVSVLNYCPTQIPTEHVRQGPCRRAREEEQTVTEEEVRRCDGSVKEGIHLWTYIRVRVRPRLPNVLFIYDLDLPLTRFQVPPGHSKVDVTQDRRVDDRLESVDLEGSLGRQT